MDIRKKLVELLLHVSKKCQKQGGVTWYDFADHLIANGVTVQERGEWIPYDYDIFGFRNVGERCSRCGHEICQVKGGVYHFCANCGADMRGSENG